MRKTRWPRPSSPGLICVALLLGSSARAQDAGPEPYRPQILPECAVYDTQAGPVCGYDDIDDVRDLYRFDAELVLRRQETQLMSARGALLSLQVRSLESAVSALQTANVALGARVDVLVNEAVSQNEKYENERAKPRFGSALAWTTAGVAVALLVGYVAADLLQEE